MEELGKCKSTVSSEKEVIFKLQRVRNQRASQRTNHSPTHGEGEHFACDILYTFDFWEEGLSRTIIEGVAAL